MGLSFHSLGMKEGARADASGAVEKGLTQECILLVFGCSEGGQCGDLSPTGGVRM